jgi:PST family polysaccharide transporter
MAWDLLRFVPDRLHRVAGRVALPAFCKLQGRDSELADAYRNFVKYIGKLVLPIAGCVALAAPEILESIYGPKWLPAAAPMRLLALGLAIVGLRIGIGTVYYTKDYPSFDIYVNGARLLMIAFVVTFTARFGLVAVSAAVGAVEGAVGIAGQYLVCRLTDMPFMHLAAAVIPGLRIAIVAVMATGVGKLVAMALDVRAPLVLAFVAAPPALVLCGFEAREIAAMTRRAFRGPVPVEVLDI